MATLNVKKVDLPTFDKLGVPATQPSATDIPKISAEWLAHLARSVSTNDVNGLITLLTDECWWRDLLALTWDLRTFQGVDEIRTLLDDRLLTAKIASITEIPELTGFDQPFPDLGWVRVHFTFENAAGTCLGVARLVPTHDPQGATVWRACNVCTKLEVLRGHPPATGAHRNWEPNHGKWADQRRREVEYADREPEVVVVGGGHSGLALAARLKVMGVPTLVVERNARIGDNWRNRYESLCLHDAVWFDHMPYIPFPPNWPVHCPAQKVADWLESYAKSMEIDYWTSATATNARKLESGVWEVTVRRGEKDRVLKPKHIVFALGFGDGTPYTPKIKGMDTFQGQILHSTQYKKASEFQGKKVVVIGACTSGHDVAADFAENGIDVTMYQRNPTYVVKLGTLMNLWKSLYFEGGPPTDVADLIDQSMPVFFKVPIFARSTHALAQMDQTMYDGLKKRGFMTTFGIEDTGIFLLALSRGGGYYIDTGASDMIVDGRIKLKAGSEISHFTKTGVVFEDGEKIDTDVILFATGLGDRTTPVRKILGPELSTNLSPIWGLDEEGELRGTWKGLGIENCWGMMGNFAWSRFYSEILALQIKAKYEGLWDGKPYAKNSGV